MDTHEKEAEHSFSSAYRTPFFSTPSLPSLPSLPLPLSLSPSLPLPLLLSLYPSPLTSQSSLSSSENSSSFSVRANLKLLSPPTIKNQAGCRKGRGRREVHFNSEFNIVDPRSVVQGWWSTWIDSSYAHLV